MLIELPGSLGSLHGRSLRLNPDSPSKAHSTDTPRQYILPWLPYIFLKHRNSFVINSKIRWQLINMACIGRQDGYIGRLPHSCRGITDRTKKLKTQSGWLLASNLTQHPWAVWEHLIKVYPFFTPPRDTFYQISCQWRHDCHMNLVDLMVDFSPVPINTFLSLIPQHT